MSTIINSDNAMKNSLIQLANERKYVRLLIKTALVITLLAKGTLLFASTTCNLNVPTLQILVGTTQVSSVCPGQSPNIKISTLQDGVTYQLTYNGTSTTPKTYWTDGNFTSISWSVGALSASLPYSISAWSDDCPTTILITGTITVVNPSGTITLNSSLSDPGHVCANQTIILSITGQAGLTYTWHSSPAIDVESVNNGTYHQATFSPDMPASYWVTATGACGTSLSSNTISVAFVPVVTNAAIGGETASRCKGSGTSTLTASASNATSYGWQILNGGSSSISSSGVVTWAANFEGQATIILTAYGCNGSTSQATKYISSSSVPPATLSLNGSSGICQGGSINNSTAVQLISNSGNLVPEVRYILVKDGVQQGGHFGYDDTQEHGPTNVINWNISQTGTYTAQASWNGCTNYPMQGTVTITQKAFGTIALGASSDKHPAPWISDSYAVCDTDNFKLIPSGSTGYTWHANTSINDLPNFDTGGYHAGTLIPPLSATYWVTGIESACNTTVSSPMVNVSLNSYQASTVQPSGNLKIKSYEQGPALTASSVVGTGYKYVWLKGGQPVTGAPNSVNFGNVSETGVYTVRTISPNGACISDSPNSLSFVRNQVAIINPDNLTITLPTNQATINANASDPDGAIQSYQWIKQTTPMEPVLSAPLTVPSLTASELHLGKYNFQVTVYDDMGEATFANGSITVNAPPNNYNYIRESAVQAEGKTTLTSLDGLPAGQKNVQTTYFDGLSRSMQVVSHSASANSQKDIVQPITYDEFGRRDINYLPYKSEEATGNYKGDAVAMQSSYYVSALQTAHDTPTSKTIFEPSPVNRVLKQGAYGAAWQPNTDPLADDYSLTKSYEINGESDILNFSYDSGTGVVYFSSGATLTWYGKGELSAVRTKDENNSEVVSYQDKDNRTVCKRRLYKQDAQGNNLYADTYYVYNDIGELVVILPPEAIRELVKAH
jgi:hypothetical protein